MHRRVYRFLDMLVGDSTHPTFRMDDVCDTGKSGRVHYTAPTNLAWSTLLSYSNDALTFFDY
jgi:hypothetical protein